MNILLVEDNAGDALLLEEMLIDVPEFLFTLEHVTSAGAAILRLERGGIDAVLLDLSLPDTQGLETVKRVCPVAPRIPLVVISGFSDEKIATLSLQEGAQDYLIKGEATGRVIARTLTYALERTRMGVELKEARTRAEVLAALADSLQEARSPEGVSQVVVETLGPALEATFMLSLRTGEGRVWLDAAWGEVDSIVHAHFLHPGFLMAGTALLEREDVAAKGVYSQPSEPALWTVPGFPELSFAAEPIVRTAQDGGSELEGFLTTWRAPEQGAWKEGERELMERSAAAVGLSLEKAKLNAALEKRNTQLEERIALALQAAGMVAWDWDIATDRVMFSHPIGRDASGLPHQSFSIRDTWSMIHPDDFERYQAHLKQLLASEERGSIRVRVGAPEAEDYFWTEEQALVRRNPAGVAVGLSGISLNIHQRVQSEGERDRLFKELERERLRLEAILTELPVGVILADGKTGEVLLSNPQANTLLQRSFARTDGLGNKDEPLFFYPDGSLVPLEQLPATRVIQKGEYVREQELLYQRSPDERIILSINTGPLGSENGISNGFVITLRDITERRTASKRIEASEARFQMYANNIQDALYISSPETNQIQYLSPAFQRIWELEPSSVLENWAGILDAVHPADRGKVEQTFRQHWKDGFDIEYRLMRDSGEVRWIRDRGFPLEGLQSMAGIAQDITDRKQADLERIQSEERLLLALESGGVVFFEWNENGGVVEFQGGADTLFGLKKGLEQMPITEFANLILEQDRELHREGIQESLRTLERYATDYRVRRGGQIRWIQGRGKVIYSGGTPIINGVFLDITDRKLAELARVESEERLQLALSSSGVVFWQWVESRHKIIFDGSASTLFGLPPETRYMDATTFLNLILEEDRTTFERSIQQAFETLERHATDIRILRRGQIRWVQVRGKVALEDGIQVINGIFLDITERKLIELRLRELNEAQKRFVSDAAHELRAPLTSIQGNLELVRLYPQMPPDEQLEAIGDAEREAARLGRLVADLLTLARGDRGVEMMEDDLKLDEVLQEAWRSALPLGRNHWMELLTLEECRVLGDRDRLKQLTLILLENALKYTPPDGKITLELKCLEGHVEFRVSDNGVGIAETDLERVFERFYRTDEARVRGEDPGGTGLGLSIGKWIAELHGGKVWLERADAGGTVAVVRLPRLELEG